MSLTPLDKNAIRLSFDRAASSYDHHAVLQREIESRLLERIEFLRHEPATVLDLGCGTGSASRTLAGQFPQAGVIARWRDVCHVDFAPAKLLQLRQSQLDRGVCGRGNRQGDQRLLQVQADGLPPEYVLLEMGDGLDDAG